MRREIRRLAVFGFAAVGSTCAYATIAVTSPATGSTVHSPVAMKAHVDNCSAASPTYIGYSIDSSAVMIAGATKTDLDVADPNIPLGPHLLHFKAWSTAGECPTVNVAVTVEPGAGITVTSPSDHATVNSPVPIAATVSECGGAPVTAFGYSLDSNTLTKKSSAVIINTTDATIPSGPHLLHFKAWAKDILCPVIDRTITVTDASGPPIPSNAVEDARREQLGSWKGSFDDGTQNSSHSASGSGSMAMVSSPQRDGQSRKFQMSFANSGGVRFSASWPTDSHATHFVYDNWVYIEDGSDIANLELDMNQVLPSRDVQIYATQCSGYSKTWEYSVNTGTVQNPKVTWKPSNLYCDPQDARQWAPNTWHHVQLAYSRDSQGNVTYEEADLDGVRGYFQNASGLGRFGLSWGPVFVTNFQLDGKGPSGSATAYSNDLSLYRW